MSPRHRPWAEAAPGFAIGLRPIGLEAWLEGQDADAARKEALRSEHPAKVWGETEGSRAAQSEVLALVEAATGRSAGPGEPLWAASLLAADDLCLMERRDGAWTLTALSLCSPTFFTAEEALGKALAGLHGPVPGFADQLLRRVERIFDNLPAGQVLERRNWTLVNSPELFLPHSAPVRERVAEIDPAIAGEVLHLRVERQTIRLLDSGGVIFTIRVWRDPLASLRGNVELMAAFEKAWREAPEAFREYKGLARYDALVEAFLKP
jgi:dimethylamine monooxygenase subunit A